MTPKPNAPVAPITSTPTPTNGQVTVDLPPGMSQEQYLKMFATFRKNTERGEKIGTAEGIALKRLIVAHKDEYLDFRKEEWTKVGLNPEKLHINRK